MMYEYDNMNEGTSESIELPSIAMNFDGNYLEEQIDGYRTLSVTGRELIAYDVNLSSVSGADGATFVSANLPSRYLRIKFMLEAKDAEDLQDKFNRMNLLLSKKQAIISFLDEPDYEFIGTLSSVNEVPEGRLTVVSSFEIVCSDPHKYKVVESMSGTGTVNISASLVEPVVPTELRIEHSTATNVYEIVNESKDLKIRLINASDSTADIIIHPSKQDIFRNGQKRPALLDWTSDLENFEVENGDVIRITPSGARLTINVRERLR